MQTTQPPLTVQEKIIAVHDFIQNKLKKKAVHFKTTKEVRTKDPEALIMKIKACSIDDRCRLWIMTNDGKWAIVKQGQIYAELICDHLRNWLLEIQDGKLQTAF